MSILDHPSTTALHLLIKAQLASFPFALHELIYNDLQFDKNEKSPAIN